MNLIGEAIIIEICGIKMYAFGAYVALGALFAAIVLGLTGRMLNLKKGAVPLTFLLSALCGILLSRIAFCLLNRELGRLTPFSFWPQVSGGGWSMFGLIGGVILGGAAAAKIAGERTGKILDALSISILPLIAAERIGESRIEDFDVSRPLRSSFLSGTFLAVGEDQPCLATYYVAAAAAVVIFVVLAFRLSRRERDGNPAIAFLLLFGSSSIITESLRYDRFLSISFVGLQQIAAAVMLAAGVILAVRRSGKTKSAATVAALVSLPVMAGIVICLEFALDRTTWNRMLIYVLMIITVSVPAVLGLNLIRSEKGESGQKTGPDRNDRSLRARLIRLKEDIVTKMTMGILRPFNRHRMVNLDHVRTDPDHPIVFLGNHAEIYGPIASALCFPVPVRFWVISRMMFNAREVRAYMYENTFSKKTFLPVFVRRFLAWYLGWLSVNIMNSLRAIPVYRDSPMKLRQTLRESVEALDQGDNLMIFPEHPDGKYVKGGISEFSPGFLMLAEAWWKKSGKKLRIMPVYANRKDKTFTFGNEINYEPENGYTSEQDRILKEAYEQMLELAGAGNEQADARA